MKRVFPNLFAKHRVRPVDDYSQELLNVLRYIAPDGSDEPTVVLLTPVFTTPLISSIRFSRARWELRSSKGAILSRKTEECSCAQPKD